MHSTHTNGVHTIGQSPFSRAGKNLRFLKKVFRPRFLGFNVYTQSHTEHWTQEYDQLKSYTRRLRGHPFITSTKNPVFDPPPLCPHASTLDGPPSPMLTSPRARHEIHTALL